MIDDLVTQGTEEPYRMFTSRAEHRLLLGCDSVYERLSPVAERLGILDDERKRRIEHRVTRIAEARAAAHATVLKPEHKSVARLLQRPDFDVARVEAFADLTEEERDGVVSELRYAGYIERQQREAEKARGDEELRIPAAMSYTLPGLSREMTEKLSFVRPASIGQASRIPGVTPAAIAILRMHVRRGAGDVQARAPEVERAHQSHRA
jgi:tRNA uridine 5-carboxymethylaminomethyl modification enzyme